MNTSALSARLPIALGISALILLCLLLGLWGVMARIDGAVIVSGRIEVEQNHQIIQHADGGVVAELPIREGMRVDAGQLLLRLEDPLLLAEITRLSAERDEALARKARLLAERDGAAALILPPEIAARRAEPQFAALLNAQDSLFTARLEAEQERLKQLALQTAQLGAQLASHQAQIAAMDDLARLLAVDIAQQNSLGQKGLSPAQALSALHREEAQLAANRARLVGAVAEAEARGAELALIASAAKTERRREALAELPQLDLTLLDLAARLATLEARQEALSIHAPMAGHVFGLRVFTPRAVVRPAEPILSLIPQTDALVISAMVPALMIDRVHLGQNVSLRLPGLDQDSAPILRAAVQQLSADIFFDEQKGPVYRAELRLLDAEQERLPQDLQLLPGMPVEAFLLTGERAPLTYLLGPMSRYFSRAFRSG